MDAAGSSLATTLLTLARTLVEVAGWFLLGQGALWVIAGRGRERNPVYRGFRFLTLPVVGLFRRLLPDAVADRQVPVLAFAALFVLWLLLAWARRLVQ